MTVQPRVSAAPLMSERRVGVIGALLAAIGPFSMSLYTPAMPEIVQAFGTTEAAVKMSLSLYFAGFAVAQLFCGPISDGLGRRPVTVAFMAIYTAASVVALFSPTVEVLIVARFLQGVGAAVGVAMSRAIVRDLFAHEQSARIMNLIGIILAVGPAAAPTIGGLTMELFGWHAIFLVMAVSGVGVALMAVFAMRETVTRDVSRIRPAELVKAYGRLLANPYFVTASLANAGASGAIYAQATMLPFIMMDRAGFTPSQFGLAMLMQSLSFVAGSVVVRLLLARFAAFRLVPAGLVLMAIAATATATLLRLCEPSFVTVMVPVGVYAFGIAFITAAMTTAAMAPFPRNAGAAAAMMGFMQMGFGLAGGAAGALIGDPVVAMATVIPAFGLISIVSWTIWRRLDEPASASVVAPQALAPEPGE
jgi:DHA1 family bicyclomycin/chloramphenicol resistance-like MFS transporter